MTEGAGSSKPRLEKEDLGVRVPCEAKQLGVLKLSSCVTLGKLLNFSPCLKFCGL